MEPHFYLPTITEPHCRSGVVIKDKMRAMEICSNPLKALWVEIAKAAVYLYN
jgi:hypothetical protein